MTGLDKIIAEIAAEAKAEAEGTVGKARAEADGILAAARSESDAKVARIDAAAAAEVADIDRSRQSATALQRRQRTLREKQALLGETLDKAEKSLYALPEKDYFELLVKLAAASAEAGEGEMLLNEKDLGRKPSDFEARVSAALPAGASLSLAKDTRPIGGGFVLKYGDVEQNCSFESIFNARADEFSDLVRPILFD